MNNLDDLKIHFGKLAPGRLIAATSQSPYFCLEALTEEALLAKVKAALRFYGEAKEALRLEANDAVFTPIRTVSAKELVAA